MTTADRRPRSPEKLTGDLLANRVMELSEEFPDVPLGLIVEELRHYVLWCARHHEPYGASVGVIT